MGNLCNGFDCRKCCPVGSCADSESGGASTRTSKVSPSNNVRSLKDAQCNEKQGVRREDIGAVVLLEKSLDKRSKSVDVAHQGMFDDKTVVVRILWKQRQNSTGKIPKSPISNLQAMDKIKQSIKKCQDIYRVVIGTKFELLGIQEDDHEQIYEYKPLQNKFTMLSDLTGMEKRSMFVVSNQWRGDQIEMIKCILALSALDNMIRNIDKFLKVTK
ncbi:uncharacterized protein LOC134341190 isoform X3 [Mobula hypostoma]|uniref:uncharacterized protein LOC134341190 isoform X3 n=1 Tax=Mobula hypostoma TaxID=723540 RepID=UPI002FC3573F